MQYLFGAANHLPVAFATPSLYTVYDTPPKLGPAAVIGISQSGASPDVVAVLDEARRQQRPDARDHERSGVSRSRMPPTGSCRYTQAESAPSQQPRRT